MEIQQLRYVVALSQEKHFGRAAQKLHVTQPTLSQQVKKLEDEISVVLFERSSHGVALTAAGQKFLPYAVTMLDQLEQGMAYMREEHGELSGIIRIAAIPTIGPYLLPKLIVQVKKKAPKLKLELYEMTTRDLMDQLKEGCFDLGLLALPINEKGIVAKSLGCENFFVALHKAHPLAKRNYLVMKDLEKEPLLILEEGHCFGDQTLEYCKRTREDEQVIFQGSSLISVLKLAEVKEGVTFVPEMALDTKAYPNLNFIPLGKPPAQREIGIIWRISSPVGRIHKFLMEQLKLEYNSYKK